MKLIKGCTIIVLVLCTLVTLAREKQDKTKEHIKPDTTENRLLRGKPCFNFSFSDINGKTVSLRKLRGKYIYIDVWATWCRPCKAELPALQKLIKEMEGKKILFLCLSCDQNRSAWEEFVKKEKLRGIQVFMGEKKKEFLRFFEAGTIPRFILLDKKGNIVNARMDTPSSKRTQMKLRNLKGI